ncbi:LacI family DNA-binding transcriptional regulator [Agrilactobacillus yilanensis]|uniref:LacI family DNA-binding transcriptional regulator n=1 Tax=Agrilactobacillus yilanensis TaxID=2485997 RepID=A0ABW4J4U5_9LACO|nr:LacI family DNA-binding transcriptional regulator [Agrilactobacillus yilanensis]
MANIQEIADYTGFSKSTVSRVLNQKNYVAPRTRDLIEAAIVKLDYVPNAMAQGLSMGQMHNIGVVLPHNEHPYYTQLINGIMAAAFAANYRIMLLPSNYEAKVELAYLQQLRRKVFDSMIFTSHEISRQTLMTYQKYGPIVVCQDPGCLPIAAAYTARVPSYVAAFEWIKAQGYQHISLLATRASNVSATSKTTFQAYEQVFHQAPEPTLIRTGIRKQQDGYAAAAYFVTQKRPLDFIFANADDVAAGARQYYLEHDLPVPAMMGQENQLSSQLLNMATIDHHLYEVGENAAKLAISGAVRQFRVESEFIVR